MITYMKIIVFLETIVPQLLHALCVGGTSAAERLTNKQALAKQFAEVLHFTLKFDDLKVFFLIL